MTITDNSPETTHNSCNIQGCPICPSNTGGTTSSIPMTGSFQNQGWTCPRCACVWSPSISGCPTCNAYAYPWYPHYTYYPYYPYSGDGNGGGSCSITYTIGQHSVVELK